MEFETSFFGTPYEYDLRKSENTTPAPAPSLIFREDIPQLLNFRQLDPEQYHNNKSYPDPCQNDLDPQHWSSILSLIQK